MQMCMGKIWGGGTEGGAEEGGNGQWVEMGKEADVVGCLGGGRRKRQSPKRGMELLWGHC